LSTTTYKKGSDKVAKRVASLVKKHHTDLADASIRIIEASKMQAGTPVRMGLATPGDKVDGYDLVVIYDGGVLLNATPPVQDALLDHAISGWQGVEKRGRKGAPAYKAYQPRKALRVHLDVVERHGAVIDEWKDAQSRLGQLTLPLSEPKKRPAKNKAKGDAPAIGSLA